MAIGVPLGLSICPRIVADDQTLTASTSLAASCLTLGFFFRRVVIDRVAQAICITRRIGWFFSRTETIEFRRIAAVTYGYEDMNPAAFLSGAHNAVNRYVV